MRRRRLSRLPRSGVESHGYIPHVVSRGKEAHAKRRNPKKKARRWVVEVCHSWFNRFRKLLVRYENLRKLCTIRPDSCMR
jgi:hypothetical protein